MTYVAIVKIVVNETNKDAVYDRINELLQFAQLGDPNGENRDWIVDWNFESIIKENFKNEN